ncbi:helix-turn-helix domain-containing protein [Paenibacillus sp. FSL H7-0323]|uniref:helix-turn-helix domain-containing protein n=1 Tax=Paenibacillus sp. FSL H7-0323 TaxID=2921433 RepID=UPI0030F5712C
MKNKYSLNEAREKAGYSVKESALVMGITEDELLMAESTPSEVSIHKAIKLSELYNLPTSLIMWNTMDI